MKKLITFLFFVTLILLTSRIKAQIINLNPDPNGEPWIAGDATPTPPDIEATIPFMVLSSASAATELPTVVDNSELIFMPPVFNQGASAACVQVAEIWYSFAYEINRLRNIPAGDGNSNKTNQYHPFYTYNFLNGGNGQNSTPYKSGFRLIEDNGCPSYDVYDDPALHNGSDDQYKYWMNQHDNYQNGMYNKISDIENIT